MKKTGICNWRKILFLRIKRICNNSSEQLSLHFHTRTFIPRKEAAFS